MDLSNALHDGPPNENSSAQPPDEASGTSTQPVTTITIQAAPIDKKALLRTQFLAEASSEEAKVQMQDAFQEQDRAERRDKKSQL